MSNIKRFNQFLNESTIGSEAIRLKWYPELDKSLFYKIVNIDPTSVRKSDISKPGKYCKWLFIQYKKGNLTNELLQDDEYTKKLSLYLYIFSTYFYKKRNVPTFYDYNELDSEGRGKKISNYSKLDILKFKYLSDFIKQIDKYYSEWKIVSEDGKYDLLFEDDKMIVLVPLNFTACRKYSINTEWCSQTFMGYDMWNRRSLLYRFISKTGDRARLSWDRKYREDWTWAPVKYPEYSSKYINIIEDIDPFEFDKFELFSYEKLDNFPAMKKMWDMITPEITEACRKYYLESTEKI